MDVTQTAPRRPRKPSSAIPPRDPPPSYEVAISHPHPQEVSEETPLLLGPDSAHTTNQIPTSSPRRTRPRPARLRREFSQTDSYDEGLGSPPLSPVELAENASLLARWTYRLKWYFRPIVKKKYWMPALHLMVINFPFALAAWVYLFVGTLVGTTLLLLLPFGVVIWWATLIGARAFSRWELALQHKFHLRFTDFATPTVPYRYQPSLLSGPRSPLLTASALQLETGSNAEDREHEIHPPEYQRSFLQTTYAMFLDPASYQPIFYFIVLKGATTLFMTPLIVALFPVSVILVAPAPLALRLLRRIGLWQADLAMEALEWVVVLE
ncbi:hypothetical protein M407DRAFT_112031 [Tulasnella calospora MUT 4182]|uniref:Uncharacterized protein n=1 Tax=Tulasnella calospora MUT 4182 TaxID=1051891 RepID=A0A0C3QUS5_9AGAM|nr:hypothetical protein M407DRAFT_112031 [Tulasnella calospora MUT 4182]